MEKLFRLLNFGDHLSFKALENIFAFFDFTFDNNACQDCGGKCCTGRSGYIFVNIDELLAISDFLGLPFDEFTRKYVKKVGYRFSFLEKISSDGFACIFFDEKDKKCLIYEARPKQCIDFPFWDGYKKHNRKNDEWEEICELCKGIKCSE